MFRLMRRHLQEIPQRDAVEILETATSGVLALSGNDGYPYAVPMSYVYCDGRIYFHGAKSGHRLDAVKGCDRASFCVVAQDDVEPLDYSTRYRSVIVFGRIRIMEDEAEIRRAIEMLAIRYAPMDTVEHREKAIADEYDIMTMYELKVEHMTGKESRSLMRERMEKLV